MTDRRKLEKYLIIGVIALFVVISATYAFFQAQLDDGVQTDVNIGSNTTDSLTFDVNNAINLNINQFNFGVGAGNLSSNATASATLLANNSSNTATYTYYVYFKINSNEFTYTTSDSKPEIILTVTDPTGQPVTSIDGLTYVQNVQTTTSDGSTQTVSGFDITTATGTFAVASAYSITANSTTPTTQNWQFTATFINLDSDQQANTGKEMDAEIMIQEEAYEYTLADVCPDGGNLANCVSDLNTLAGDGASNLYYHDADLANGAQDNSYRYSGANPNNYVCFGSEAEICPDDNLYRIIGVFDNQVKLIKATSIGNYAWDSGSSNTWDETTKPDIYNTLNTTYYETLSSEWKTLINQTHTWQVGGMTFENGRDVAKTVYDYEVGINQTGYEETMAIGLIYVSDYGYASDYNDWSIALYDYFYSSSYSGSNWLYLEVDEWTISPFPSFPDSAFYVRSRGDLNITLANSGSNSVRPAFYLNSNVGLEGGSGTESDPYLLAK